MFILLNKNFLFVLILEKDFFILTMQMKIVFSNLKIERQIFINSEISLCEKQHIFICCNKNEKNEINRRETQQNNMLLSFY